ncbi:hypothetical protein B9X66_00655 [Acinetobacter pittii]|nr:hypothetical protein B9X66_00655 [Acinetobacter pittii]OTN39128.1 hypothetical protein B9Y11_12435 [Acinetobacter pittii]OTS08393.1 hypothetical protein CAT21_20130 [Acinetobacter pittii]OTT37472.1 hypothetical protein CAS79_13560 [Acinetobacter pittii]RSO28595.1 hypothetical protein EA761_07965 [Acinetobacter pittii]
MLFWEKKRHSKAVKTVFCTSQVLLLIKFFGRDELKPESANRYQAAYKFKSCRYRLWQRLPRD